MIRLCEIACGDEKEWNVIYGLKPRFDAGTRLIRSIELTPQEAALPIGDIVALFQTKRLSRQAAEAQKGNLL